MIDEVVLVTVTATCDHTPKGTGDVENTKPPLPPPNVNQNESPAEGEVRENAYPGSLEKPVRLSTITPPALEGFIHASIVKLPVPKLSSDWFCTST